MNHAASFPGGRSLFCDLLTDVFVNLLMILKFIDDFDEYKLILLELN